MYVRCSDASFIYFLSPNKLTNSHSSSCLDFYMHYSSLKTNGIGVRPTLTSDRIQTMNDDRFIATVYYLAKQTYVQRYFLTWGEKWEHVRNNAV